VTIKSKLRESKWQISAVVLSLGKTRAARVYFRLQRKRQDTDRSVSWQYHRASFLETKYGPRTELNIDAESASTCVMRDAHWGGGLRTRSC
jgi:hypothetical protein